MPPPRVTTEQKGNEVVTEPTSLRVISARRMRLDGRRQCGSREKHMAFHRNDEPSWSAEDADWSAFSDGLEVDDEAFAQAIIAGRQAEVATNW